MDLFEKLIEIHKKKLDWELDCVQERIEYLKSIEGKWPKEQLDEAVKSYTAEIKKLTDNFQVELNKIRKNL